MRVDDKSPYLLSTPCLTCSRDEFYIRNIGKYGNIVEIHRQLYFSMMSLIASSCYIIFPFSKHVLL